MPKDQAPPIKIGILNAYDARNRGDQAIVLCQIELLRRKFQNAEFLVFSRHAVTNAPVLDGPSVESVESLLHIPPQGNPLIRFFHPLWDLLRWWLGNRSGKFGKFHGCNLYVLCGGGYLYSSHSPVISRNLACICLEILFATSTGRPVFQFPQSFGPITKALDRWFVLKVCAALQHLTPRTRIGYDQLEKWGFAAKGTILPDTVLSMRHLVPDLYPVTPARSGLGVAPVNYTFAMKMSEAEHLQYVTNLAEVCRWYHQRTGETIHLFTQVCLPGDDDSVVVDELARILKDRGVPFIQVPKQSDLKTYVNALGGMRAVISARMHACIFSLTARVPVVGLAYQPKFIGLYQLFNLENWVRPLHDWSVDWACQRLEEILDPVASPLGRIESRIKDLEHQLSDYMDKLIPQEFADALSQPVPVPARKFPPAQWLMVYSQIRHWIFGRSAGAPPRPRLGQALALTAATLYMALLAFFHLRASPHMTLMPFYLAPCLLLALAANVRWATFFAVATSLLAPLIQYFGDPDYQSPAVLAWNFLMRFLLAQFLVLIISRIHRDRFAWIKAGWHLPLAKNQGDRETSLLTALLYLGLLAFFHLHASPHLTLMPFYLVPCIFLALTASLRWATFFTFATSLIAPLIQYFGDPDYQSTAVLAWNFLMRLLLAQFLVLVSTRFRLEITTRAGTFHQAKQ